MTLASWKGIRSSTRYWINRSAQWKSRQHLCAQQFRKLRSRFDSHAKTWMAWQQDSSTKVWLQHPFWQACLSYLFNHLFIERIVRLCFTIASLGASVTVFVPTSVAEIGLMFNRAEDVDSQCLGATLVYEHSKVDFAKSRTHRHAW
jgi:tRNA(Glu) U13 pseudouridine synthase TruD